MIYWREKNTFDLSGDKKIYRTPPHVWDCCHSERSERGKPVVDRRLFYSIERRGCELPERFVFCNFMCQILYFYFQILYFLLSTIKHVDRRLFYSIERRRGCKLPESFVFPILRFCVFDFQIVYFLLSVFYRRLFFSTERRRGCKLSN